MGYAKRYFKHYIDFWSLEVVEKEIRLQRAVSSEENFENKLLHEVESANKI